MFVRRFSKVDLSIKHTGIFPLKFPFQFFVAKVVAPRKFSTYPAFITNAPVTEVSKTTNGVRVASEVCTLLHF